MKNAIFGGNDARLFNVAPTLHAEPEGDALTAYRALYDRHGDGRSNLDYGYMRRRS